MTKFKGISCLCLSFLLIVGCTKDVRQNDWPGSAGKAGTSSSGKLSEFTQYTIPSGEHYSIGNDLHALDVTQYRFQVYFDSSAIYAFDDDDQLDINKLSGFSDNGGLHQQYSARIGWRWSSGKLRLFGYVHNDGNIEAKELASIALNKIYTCSILIAGNKYVFKIEELQKSVTLPRKALTSSSMGYQLYPYFGGNKIAPHTVTIWIKCL